MIFWKQIVTQYILMGNSEDKQEKPPQNPIQESEDKKKGDKKKDQPYPVMKSGRKDKDKSKRQNNENSPNKNILNSKRESALSNIHNLNSSREKNNKSVQSNKKVSFQQPQSEDDQNQFMPMMMLPQSGSIPLNITILVLSPSSNPKPCISRNFTQYEGTLQWKMNTETNVYQFMLKGQALQINVDLQGTPLNKQHDLWAILCPLDILFNQKIKIGQYECAHYYESFDHDAEDEVSPSMKSISLGVEESLFDKWGEDVPQTLKEKKTPKCKFTEYKELSRYFNRDKKWVASTMFSQTNKEMKVWVVVNSEMRDRQRLEKMIFSDLQIRQRRYIEAMNHKIRSKS